MRLLSLLSCLFVVVCSVSTASGQADAPDTPVAPSPQPSPIGYTWGTTDTLPPAPPPPVGAYATRWTPAPQYAPSYDAGTEGAVAYEWEWYGWQNLLLDGIALALVPLAGDDAELPVGTYVWGGPIVHWSHGNVGRGFASLGLRLGAPITVGLVFAGNCDSTEAEYGCLGDALTGILVGMGAAVILDATALAWEKEPVVKSMEVGGVQISPTLSADGSAGLMAVGTF